MLVTGICIGTLPHDDCEGVSPSGSSRSSPKRSPRLHRCVAKGDLKGVLQCLANGSNFDEAVTIANESGNMVSEVTPLWLAASSGYYDIVHLLVTSGANLTHAAVQGKKSCTPSQVARLNLHFKVARYLQKARKAQAQAQAQTTGGKRFSTMLARTLSAQRRSVVSVGKSKSKSAQAVSALIARATTMQGRLSATVVPVSESVANPKVEEVEGSPESSNCSGSAVVQLPSPGADESTPKSGTRQRVKALLASTLSTPRRATASVSSDPTAQRAGPALTGWFSTIKDSTSKSNSNEKLVGDTKPGLFACFTSPSAATREVYNLESLEHWDPSSGDAPTLNQNQTMGCFGGMLTPSTRRAPTIPRERSTLDLTLVQFAGNSYNQQASLSRPATLEEQFELEKEKGDSKMANFLADAAMAVGYNETDEEAFDTHGCGAVAILQSPQEAAEQLPGGYNDLSNGVTAHMLVGSTTGTPRFETMSGAEDTAEELEGYAVSIAETIEYESDHKATAIASRAASSDEEDEEDEEEEEHIVVSQSVVKPTWQMESGRWQMAAGTVCQN